MWIILWGLFLRWIVFARLRAGLDRDIAGLVTRLPGARLVDPFLRDFAGASGVRLNPQKPRATGDDMVKLILGVKLQPGRNAKAVAQGRGQQAQPRGGPHQRKGLQINPHRARCHRRAGLGTVW